VTEAEALVMAEDSALTRFANSEIHQNVAESNVTINLRVVVGKRVGVASSGRTDEEGLRRLAEMRRPSRVGTDDWGGSRAGPTSPVPAGTARDRGATPSSAPRRSARSSPPPTRQP
jgi:predicted Zn-dependent protease